MDAWTLGLEEGMRFWANSGLRHILCDKDVNAYGVARETRPVIQNGTFGASQGAAAKPMPARPGWAEPRKRTAAQSAPAGQFASHPSAGRPDPQQQPQRPQQPQQSKPQSLAPAPSRGNEVHAPQFVQSDGELAVYPYELFRKRLRVPSRTIWTYWDLGHDFGAAPNDERRELFRTILKHLSWPAGSVSFWPLTFELGADLKAQPGQFWRGVREARATAVFCFGERAYKALFPRQDFSLAPTQRDGVVVQPLPGPTAMLAGDMEAKRTVWGMLKAHAFSS